MRINEVSVRHFGAVGDSAADDYPALQRALDSGEKYLYVPCGKYRINGTLCLHSNTYLRLHPRAELILGDGVGVNCDSYLLTADRDSFNITVEGGIWNGNNEANPNVIYAEGGSYIGIMISFTKVSRLTLRGMTMRDSGGFHLRLNYVTDFLVEHITYDDIHRRISQDGVHIGGGCERGIIRHIRCVGQSSVNDDLIALISDLSTENMSDYDPIRGQLPGDIRDISIYDVRADNTFSFLRLLSWKCKIENITAEDFEGGFYYLAMQLQISPYLRHGKTDNSSGVYGTGNIRNVRISHWNVFHCLPAGTQPANYMHTDCNGIIDVEQRLEDFIIEDFRRDYEKDSMPALPTLYMKNYRNNRLELVCEDQASVMFGGGSHEPLSDRQTGIKCNEYSILALSTGEIAYLGINQRSRRARRK